MSWEEEVSRRLNFHQREIVEKDKRIGWLENELKVLRSQLLAAGVALSASGVSDEELNDAEDPASPGNKKAMGAGNQIGPVKCENDPGGAKAFAPFNHQHQGVHAITIAACAGPAGDDLVGDVNVADGGGIALIVDPANPGAPVNDAGNNPVGIPVGGGGQWNPTQCNASVLIGHRFNPWAAVFNPGCASPFQGLCETGPGGETWIPSTCTDIKTIKSFKVDCWGHVTDIEELNLQIPAVIDGATTSGGCCTDIDVVVGATFTCLVDSPDSKKWSLALDKKTINIPQDNWDTGSDPGCSGGETEVITDIQVSAKSGCPCAYDIVVTRGCVGSGGGDPHTSITVVTGVCYDASTCEIKIITRTVEVLNPSVESAPTAISSCP